MRQLSHLRDFPEEAKGPIILTIGNFDGIHRGHQLILNTLSDEAQSQGGSSVALSFLNHPREILQAGFVVPKLCTVKQKLRCLEQESIDYVLLIPFTKIFSQQTPELFLAGLRKFVPFTQLVLGHDARIGKNREGSPERIRALAKDMGFSVRYIPPLELEGKPVSSSRIRKFIEEGNLKAAAQLLARPYSLEGTVIPGSQKGQKLGFPTANIDVATLCLPPCGVYAVTATIQGKTLPGIANLGHAPTLQDDRPKILEVHFFEPPVDPLYGTSMEVTPKHFLRSEAHFSSAEALKKQINADITKAREQLSIPKQIEESVLHPGIFSPGVLWRPKETP